MFSLQTSFFLSFWSVQVICFPLFWWLYTVSTDKNLSLKIFFKKEKIYEPFSHNDMRKNNNQAIKATVSLYSTFSLNHKNCPSLSENYFVKRLFQQKSLPFLSIKINI